MNVVIALINGIGQHVVYGVAKIIQCAAVVQAEKVLQVLKWKCHARGHIIVSDRAKNGSSLFVALLLYGFAHYGIFVVMLRKKVPPTIHVKIQLDTLTPGKQIINAPNLSIRRR